MSTCVPCAIAMRRLYLCWIVSTSKGLEPCSFKYKHMQWTASRHSQIVPGISVPSVEPWIPNGGLKTSSCLPHFNSSETAPFALLDSTACVRCLAWHRGRRPTGLLFIPEVVVILTWFSVSNIERQHRRKRYVGLGVILIAFVLLQGNSHRQAMNQTWRL
ncbi:hypothetical protein EDB84DRAFT_685479 [Lactarius hengduanensis]|nr:hypothetical protein EDB84DRAFT_685479 [Lactarius hengduanensis]